MKYLVILFLTFLLSDISYSQELRQTPNYYGGYNYYVGTRIVFQTRPGFGRENVYQGTRKIGELRTFGNTQRFYFSNPQFSFRNGKVTIKK